MRRFSVQTRLTCSPQAAWEAAGRRALLEYVTHPLLKIMPPGLAVLPDRFEKGAYELKLYGLGFAPLGRHTVRVVQFDPERRELYTEESGTLVKTWNHRITISTDEGGRTIYRDLLELNAGRLTPLFWGLAYGFYRYRQARWRLLARTVLAGRG